MWEQNADINKVSEIRIAARVYLGCGAINKMHDVALEMKQRDITSLLCITGKGAYRKTGAWEVVTEALKEQGITIAHYDGATPNPTMDQVDEAAALGRKSKVQAVLAIGGGSPIDTAKSAAILLSNPEFNARQLYRGEFVPSKALPIVVINLTHGTGSEANRFAVATDLETEHKPAIAYDCIYPWISIDDPALMTSLSHHQTLSTSVDAVNHVVEAATTIMASPFSILTAKETTRLVVKHLPTALENPNDLTARYWLLYASMIAGSSFDNGMLHLTHALEHPLSAVKPDLSHGIGLGVLLPSIVYAIYPSCAEVLADVLKPLAPDLTGKADEARAAGASVQNWLNSLGLTEHLGDIGFTKEQIPHLTRLAFDTPSLGSLLACAPIEVTEEVVTTIFQNSFSNFE